MIGDFIEGVRTRKTVRPDFAAGTEVQRILDAALLSHQEGRRVLIEEINFSHRIVNLLRVSK